MCTLPGITLSIYRRCDLARKADTADVAEWLDTKADARFVEQASLIKCVLYFSLGIGLFCATLSDLQGWVPTLAFRSSETSVYAASFAIQLRLCIKLLSAPQ